MACCHVKYFYVFAFFYFALTSHSTLAGIQSTTPSTVHLVQGDTTTLLATGTDIIGLSWFFEGDKVSSESSYQVATSQLQVGSYAIDLVAQTPHYHEVVRFLLHVSKAPPLYRSQNIIPKLDKPKSLSKISKERPWALSTKGQFEFRHILVASSKWTPTTFFSQLNDGDALRVGNSNQALIGGLDGGDQLHMVGPAQVESTNGRLTIRKGFALLRRFSSPKAALSLEIDSKAVLKPSGLGDVFVNLRSTGAQSIVDVVAIGSSLQFSCFGKDVQLKTPVFVSIQLNNSTKTCTQRPLKNTSHLSHLLKLALQTQPMWQQKYDDEFLRLFRIEYSIKSTERISERYDGGMGGAFENKDWTAVLDIYGHLFKEKKTSSEQLMMVGKSQFRQHRQHYCAHEEFSGYCRL